MPALFRLGTCGHLTCQRACGRGGHLTAGHPSPCPDGYSAMMYTHMLLTMLPPVATSRTAVPSLHFSAGSQGTLTPIWSSLAEKPMRVAT